MDFKDGYQTLITFALDADFQFWEKSTQPPGLDAGGGIDTSTMHNQKVRTMFPKALQTVTDQSLSGAWAFATYAEVKAMLGVNQLITTTLPDGSTVAVWGWINKFTPDNMEEGEHPTATLEIMQSNTNNLGAEVEPVFTAAPAA